MNITTEQALEYIEGIMDDYDLQPRQRIGELVRAIERSDDDDEVDADADADASKKKPEEIDDFEIRFGPGGSDPFGMFGDVGQPVTVQLYRMEERGSRAKGFYHFLEEFSDDDGLDYVRETYGPGLYALRKCVGGKWRKQVTFRIGG